MTTSEAFEYCKNIATKHYENFPVGLFIPKSLKKYVYSIYAFARFADDIADDENIPIEDRKSGLLEWLNMLDKCYEEKADHPIFIALMETKNKFQIPKELFENLIKAFLMDIEKNRFYSFDEILYYCNYSANPIGRLILLLFKKNNEENLLLSDKICTALQITNFLQDVNLDLKKNRIYFPLDDFMKNNYSEVFFFNKVMNQSFINIINNQIEKTEYLFNEGEKLLRNLNGKLKFEITLTIIGGKSILDKVKKNKEIIFEKRPKLNLIDKIIILFKAIKKWILT